MSAKPDILISSCKLFRATLVSKKRRKHIEYKIARRKTEEVVGFVYPITYTRRQQWVFTPLLSSFTPVELMDLATFVTEIRLRATGEADTF